MAEKSARDTRITPILRILGPIVSKPIIRPSINIAQKAFAFATGSVKATTCVGIWISKIASTINSRYASKGSELKSRLATNFPGFGTGPFPARIPVSAYAPPVIIKAFPASNMQTATAISGENSDWT